MIKGIFKIVAMVILMLLLMALLLITIGKNQLHDEEIKQKASLIESASKLKILALFPHPDDEVTVSGTLMKLIDEGHEVHLICLTRGEAGNSGEQYTKDNLAALRTKEMKRAASLIGIHKLHQLTYPDGDLDQMGLDSIKGIVLDWVEELKPAVLISYDSKVGLYGHSDHRLSGLAVEQVYVENKGRGDFSASQLFQVTLSPKQIQVALKLSSGFQRNYPKNLEKGLPRPDFSISIQPYFERVLQVMQSHETQQAVLKDLMPYHDRVPVWIYSRIFDREYFHQVH